MKLQNSGHGRLKAGVVVGRHFVLDVIAAQIVVVVVLIGSADQRAGQQLRIRLSTVVRIPIARRRTRRTRAGTMVRPLRVILPSPNHERTAGVAENVIHLHLLRGESSILVGVDAKSAA